MKFKLATPEVGYIKAGLYGDTGSGKTLTSLILATSLGKTLIIDTEQSGSLYAPKEGVERKVALPPYYRLATRDIIEATEAIEQAYKDGFDAVIVDQVGHFWEFCQEYSLGQEKEKGTKTWFNYEKNDKIPFALWRRIKSLWKHFIKVFNDVPMHTFLCGRMAIEYDISQGGTKIEKIGERMVGEKEVMYEPTLLLKMSRASNGNIKALVEKDKTGFLQGCLFMNPTADILQDIVEFLGKNDHKRSPESNLNVDSSGESVMANTHPSVRLILVYAEREGYNRKEVQEKLANLSLTEVEKLKLRIIQKDYSFFKNQEEA